MSWANPSHRNTGDLITAAIWNQDAVDNPQYLYDNKPEVVGLLHVMSRVTAGNALAFTSSSSQVLNSYWRQSASANADSFELSVELVEGTYDIEIMGVTLASAGMIDWTLDGASIATGQDWYSASSTVNVKKTISSVSMTGSGRHLLVGTVNGKNASSSSYDIPLTLILFRATDYTQGV